MTEEQERALVSELKKLVEAIWLLSDALDNAKMNQGAGRDVADAAIQRAREPDPRGSADG